MFPKPDDFFKQAFEQWEKQTSDYWNNMLRDPAFLKSSWQMMESSLQSQRQFNQLMQQYFQAWQIPTRETHDRILHQLNRLQIMMDDLNERMDDLLSRPGSPPTPPANE
jgi:hypothetical protein